MNRRMKTGLLLALFLSLVVGSLSLPNASAAILGSWVPSVTAVRGSAAGKPIYNVIDAVAKFEGTLQAYSASNTLNIAEKVFDASEDINSALAELNTAITDQWANLDENERETLISWYNDLSVGLENLMTEATTVFNSEESIVNVEFNVIYTASSIPRFSLPYVAREGAELSDEDLE